MKILHFTSVIWVIFLCTICAIFSEAKIARHAIVDKIKCKYPNAEFQCSNNEIVHIIRGQFSNSEYKTETINGMGRLKKIELFPCNVFCTINSAMSWMREEFTDIPTSGVLNPLGSISVSPGIYNELIVANIPVIMRRSEYAKESGLKPVLSKDYNNKSNCVFYVGSSNLVITGFAFTGEKIHGVCMDPNQQQSIDPIDNVIIQNNVFSNTINSIIKINSNTNKRLTNWIFENNIINTWYNNDVVGVIFKDVVMESLSFNNNKILCSDVVSNNSGLYIHKCVNCILKNNKFIGMSGSVGDITVDTFDGYMTVHNNSVSSGISISIGKHITSDLTFKRLDVVSNVFSSGSKLKIVKTSESDNDNGGSSDNDININKIKLLYVKVMNNFIDSLFLDTVFTEDRHQNIGDYKKNSTIEVINNKIIKFKQITSEISPHVIISYNDIKNMENTIYLKGYPLNDLNMLPFIVITKNTIDEADVKILGLNNYNCSLGNIGQLIKLTYNNMNKYSFTHDKCTNELHINNNEQSAIPLKTVSTDFEKNDTIDMIDQSCNFWKDSKPKSIKNAISKMINNVYGSDINYIHLCLDIKRLIISESCTHLNNCTYHGECMSKCNGLNCTSYCNCNYPYMGDQCNEITPTLLDSLNKIIAPLMIFLFVTLVIATVLILLCSETNRNRMIRIGDNMRPIEKYE